MAPHLIPEGHRIGTPGSRARYCPVSIQPRARHQAGHPSAIHHMPVVRRLEYVPVRTVRGPDLLDSQFCDALDCQEHGRRDNGGPAGRRVQCHRLRRPLVRRPLPREPEPASRRDRKGIGWAPGGVVVPRDVQTGQGPYTLPLAVVAPADGNWRARPRSGSPMTANARRGRGRPEDMTGDRRRMARSTAAGVLRHRPASVCQTRHPASEAWCLLVAPGGL